MLSAITYIAKFTGLYLNILKMITYSPSQTDPVTLHGVVIVAKPVKYLGAYLGLGNLSALNFESPLRNKIQCWNKRNLSLKAKVTIIKTFIFSLFTHILNMVFITNNQLDVIQKILNDFLWHGKPKYDNLFAVLLRKMVVLTWFTFEILYTFLELSGGTVSVKMQV